MTNITNNTALVNQVEKELDVVLDSFFAKDGMTDLVEVRETLTLWLELKGY